MLQLTQRLRHIYSDIVYMLIYKRKSYVRLNIHYDQLTLGGF